MNVANCSTNAVSPLVVWYDGAQQQLTLQPGQFVTGVVGVYSNTVLYAETYDTRYEAVYGNAGLQVHTPMSGLVYFMSGFFWALPMAAGVLAIYMVLAGLRLKPLHSEA